MSLNRFHSLATLLLLAACPLAPAQQAPAETLKLWPGSAPDATPAKGPEHELPLDPKSPDITRLTDVSEPSILVFQPPVEKRNKTAVLICPGGGYSILATTHEGTQVAEWLNGLGVTAVVLKYRCPAPQGKPRHLQALEDGQRAMSLIRENAGKWGLDPERIGALGFSAGGNLAAWLLCEGNRRAYQVGELGKEAACRPNFGLLIYPAYLMDDKGPVPTVRSEEKPGEAFFIHANDDKLSSEGSVHLYLELKKAEVPAELHIYAEGGHGFGMLKRGKPANEWPRRAAEWLESRGWLKN